MKNIRFIHIDMAWTGTPGKPFQWYAWGLLRALRERHGVEARCTGPCSEKEAVTSNDVLAVLLPWKGFQSQRDFRRLAYCVKQANASGNPLICIADDPYRLEWAGPHVAKAEVPVYLFSNYVRDPTEIVKGWEKAAHVPWLAYPFDQILTRTIIVPNHRLGYVGRYLPTRSRLFEEVLPTDGLLIGPQWSKQNKFKSIFTEAGGVEWYDLNEAYGRCEWHVMVSDARQNELQPAVSRVGEALACSRPLLFHSSCCDARVDIPWDDFSELVWSNEAELEESIATLSSQLVIKRLVRDFLPLYYKRTDLTGFVQEVFQ